MERGESRQGDKDATGRPLNGYTGVVLEEVKTPGTKTACPQESTSPALLPGPC